MQGVETERHRESHPSVALFQHPVSKWPGAAFRTIAERVGYQELSGIRRQHEAWQREASSDFARGEPGRAFDRYQQHGAIHFAESRGKAKEELIGAWGRAAEGGGKASLITHTRADVRELNLNARAILRERGALGQEVRVEVARELAADDGTITIERGERLFAQGATVDGAFVLATPRMDRHLTYVAMTRHRDGAEVYAGRDDFKGFDELKERLSRARPKDSTLDYARRRGMEAARARAAEEERPMDRQRERARRPEPEAKAQGQERKQEAGQGDPVARFKEAQKEFIQVAGMADFDPKAKARASELRGEMKRASQEIAKDPARMRAAEREGIAPQVRNFVRQAERGRGREKAGASIATRGWSGNLIREEPGTGKLQTFGSSAKRRYNTYILKWRSSGIRKRTRPTWPSMASTSRTLSGSSRGRYWRAPTSAMTMAKSAPSHSALLTAASWRSSTPCGASTAGLSQQGEHTAVNAKRIVRRTLKSRRRGKTDWARVDAMSDREIENAVKSDPDAAPILDKEWFRKAKLVLPERKVPISLRMDREVVEWFKARGRRYQSRMNAVLKAYVEAHRKAG